MRFSVIIWSMLLLPCVLLSQEQAVYDLLLEAESKLYSQPEQSGKISTYVIDQKESTAIQIEAELLLAKSFYIRGNFNEAVKNALEAKKLADAFNNLELKLKTTTFALQLLRELGLSIVADDYLKELNSLAKEKVRDKNLSIWISGKLLQDSAIINFNHDKFSEAKQGQEKAKALFSKIDDSITIREIDISLAEIDLRLDEDESAKIGLDKNLKTANDFQKLQSLSILGQLYFNEKNYAQAVTVFQQALLLSEKLPNKFYENKSIQGLTVSYLALEDAKNFNLNKQRSNLSSLQVETDKNTAVNSVYNFINAHQKELAQNNIKIAYFWLYGLAGLFILLMGIGGIINYWYVSKNREYVAIWKYIQPKKPVEIIAEVKEQLQKSSIIPEETEQIILQKLNKFEAGTKFTNPDMSIAFLASKFDTNTKYLSEVINRQKGKNFNSYINELRINYIIEKLKTDPVYFNYKISYLAEESGFSSHSSFATVFKSVTGISPTRFMEFLQKRQETI